MSATIRKVGGRWKVGRSPVKFKSKAKAQAFRNRGTRRRRRRS